MAETGAKTRRGLEEAASHAAADPIGGYGACPMPGSYHVIGPWDTSYTGGREGVSCRRCHKTWLKVDGIYVETFSVNARTATTHSDNGTVET